MFAFRVVRFEKILPLVSVCLCLFSVPLVTAQTSRFVDLRYAFAGNPLASALEVADLNDDSIPDLLVASYQADRVFALLGDGHGGFRVSSTLSVGDRPISFASGDFNEDGNDEFLLVDSAKQSVTVYLGDGLGAFEAVTALHYSTEPRAVVVGFIDSDTHLDLVVGVDGPIHGGAGQAIVYRGTGSGEFFLDGQHIVPALAAHMILSDVNGDSRTDLIVASPGFAPSPNGGLSVFLGDDLGGLTLANELFGHPQHLAIADFDEDGFKDIAASLDDDVVCSPPYAIYFGDGSGAFNRVDSFVGCLPQDVVTADFDGDGHADLVFRDPFDTKILFGFGNGVGLFDFTTELLVPFPLSQVVSDFDGNGKPDLAVANADGLAVFLNEPDHGPATFIRGDADADGVFNVLADAIFILNFGFVAGSPEPPCMDSADVDDNGVFNPIADALRHLCFGFLPCPPLPPPFPDCGIDPTLDSFSCEFYPCP